jgi:hypothetical protein
MRIAAPLVVLAVGLVGAASAQPTDEVLASRLIVKLDSLDGIPSLKVEGVPNDALVERCRDYDGCKVTIKIDGPNGMAVQTTHFFESAHSFSVLRASLHGHQ